MRPYPRHYGSDGQPEFYIPLFSRTSAKKMAALRRVPFCSLLFWIHLARRNHIAGTLSATYRLIPLSICSRQVQGKGPRHVSLFPDRRLIASAYTYWWCVVLTGAMYIPRTSWILLHDIRSCLNGIVFLGVMCPPQGCHIAISRAAC